MHAIFKFGYDVVAKCCFQSFSRLMQSSSSSIVPTFCHWEEMNRKDFPPCRILTNKEVEHLESISLVQYKHKGVEKARLEEIIRYADSLQLVNTDNIEPMPYVYENACLYLREDKVIDKGCVKNILKNAKIVEEDYFVAPPGNVTFLDSKNDSIENIDAN